MNIYSIEADMLCPSDEDGLIAPYETKVVCLSDHAAVLQAEREKHAAEVAELKRATLNADLKMDALKSAIKVWEEGAQKKDAEIERLHETATSRGRCIEDTQHTIARRDAAIARLKKDNSGLHEVQDEQRGIIADLRAELTTAKARIAELEDNSLESLSTSDQVLVADMQRRLDETRAELATARAEAQHNADAAEALAGLESACERCGIGPVLSGAIRAQLAAVRAEEQAKGDGE